MYVIFVNERWRQFKEEGSTLTFKQKNDAIKSEWTLIPMEVKLARKMERHALRYPHTLETQMAMMTMH